MFTYFTPTLIVIAMTILSGAARVNAQAQTTDLNVLQPVLVTGNPLRNGQQDATAQQLSGAELQWRRTSTLGALLDGLPGVSASAFGPQASRPILRGLDGDRLSILSNGASVLDASSLSADHAVALDPLVIERVELVRGPSALLYGGQALGGVINTLDNRIPQGQSGGALDVRWGGASRERVVAGVVDGGPASGARGWAWHGDFSRRLSDNQSTPRFVLDEQSQTQVRNSDGAQRSVAGGLGYVAPEGYAGLSVDDYRTEYGVTAEPDVRIRMQRQHLAQAGEWRFSQGFLRRVAWNLASTRYEHDEVEGTGEVGTRFNMRGHDARLELEHAPLGPVRGVVGLQLNQQRFSALGEEAFVPSTQSRHKAAFVLEQWQEGAWQLAGGARLEQVRQSSAGDAPDGLEPRFGSAQSQRFNPRSFSVQAAWQASPAWRLQVQASRSQRAPTHYELYANGVHVATAAFERGDATLGLEQAKGLDAAVQYLEGNTQLQLNAYTQRFSRYIALQAQAEVFETEEGESLPIYAFTAVPARLQGWELQWTHRLAERVAAGSLQLSASLDAVQGANRSNGAPLPRLVPRRLRLGLHWERGPWSLRLGATQAARQNRPSPDDTPTPSHHSLDVGASYAFKVAGLDAQWSLKGQNLRNQLQRNAATVPTLRELAPLPGRNWHTSLLLRW
jgi:iron complex outermembrane recepter protein